MSLFFLMFWRWGGTGARITRAALMVLAFMIIGPTTIYAQHYYVTYNLGEGTIYCPGGVANVVLQTGGHVAGAVVEVLPYSCQRHYYTFVK